DHIYKLSPISLRGPDLKTIHFRIGHHPRVEYVRIELGGQVGAPLLVREVPKAAEKALERGQPLLAVDNLPPINVGGWGLLLIEHNRAQEVYRRVMLTLQRLHELVRKVLPKWFPLLFPIPHVLPLKQWHLKAQLPFEDRQQWHCICVHRADLALWPAG